MTALALFLAPTLGAQTFVVDAANGPGASYTSIAAAVAAVPSGSTLIVRPGVYNQGIDIQGKALTILGGPGVVLDYSAFITIWIRNTSPAQEVVIRGLDLPSQNTYCRIESCAGLVVIEDVTDRQGPISSLFPRPSSWTVVNSAQVLFRGCSSLHSSCADSDVVLEGCTFVGDSRLCGLGTCTSALPGLTVAGGSTQIFNCTIRGGNAGPGAANQPGILATNGSLRLLAPSTIEAGNAVFYPPSEAITGTGTLRLDPGVSLVSSITPPIAPAISSQVMAMPAVRGRSAPPGGTVTAHAFGPLGTLSVLLVGLPGPPASVPGIADPFWLDPATYFIQSWGANLPGAPVTGTVPVPSSPTLLGARLAWQSVLSSGTGGSGLQASNPTLTLVR